MKFIGLLTLNFLISGKVLAENNWHNLSPLDSAYEGIGTEKTYLTFGEPVSKDIIVAVVDGGVDVNHEDLQGKIWKNTKEIENNGIDDDQNGYIDDIFGWNFVGNPTGMAFLEKDSRLQNGFRLIKGKLSGQVQHGNSELVLEIIHMQKLKAEREASGLELSIEENNYLQNIQAEAARIREFLQKELLAVQVECNSFIEHSQILKENGLLDINLKSVADFVCTNTKCEDSKSSLIEILKKHDEEKLRNKLKEAELDVWSFREDSSPYDIVNDDNGNISLKHYGNNDVIGPSSFHGTQVAGLIAANRKNNQGALGVVENVKIMAIRVVPDGGGRSKDIANGILYAVDNGAKIINLSLGDRFRAYDEYYLDEAIKYAEDKDVLIVHAAGNDMIDLDIIPNYPNRIFDKEKREFTNWIGVGSTNKSYGPYLFSFFSNYGKNSVDVFAPGMSVYTTMVDNSYGFASGTSMSAPVVSGAAALLLSYKHDLTANEIKNLLIQTSRRHPDLIIDVWRRQNGVMTKLEIPFQSLSIGGIVDVFAAVSELKPR